MSRVSPLKFLLSQILSKPPFSFMAKLRAHLREVFFYSQSSQFPRPTLISAVKVHIDGALPLVFVQGLVPTLLSEVSTNMCPVFPK